MKRLLVSTLSAAVSVGMVAPAFAYVTNHSDIDVQTSPYHNGRPARRVIKSRFGRVYNRPTVGQRRVHYSDTEREVAPVNTDRVIPNNAGGIHRRVRMQSTDNQGGRILLRRSEGRRFRRLNRTLKPDSDRYRTLNRRQNTRSLRRSMDGASLPSAIVQTGGNGYDKPTRRDIRENRAYGKVNDRDRNLLLEIENSSR